MLPLPNCQPLILTYTLATDPGPNPAFTLALTLLGNPDIGIKELQIDELSTELVETESLASTI